MNKTLIINSIIKHYNFKNDGEFASLLGITAQVLSNWKSRNTFDPVLIYTKCEIFNAEWILTGNGVMLKSDVSNQGVEDLKKEVEQLERLNSIQEKMAAVLREFNDELKTRISTLEKEISELKDSGNGYGSSVQRGAVEFLNEPQLGGIPGKKG